MQLPIVETVVVKQQSGSQVSVRLMRFSRPALLRLLATDLEVMATNLEVGPFLRLLGLLVIIARITYIMYT